MNGLWQESHREWVEKYSDLVPMVWAQVQKDFAMEAIALETSTVNNLDDIYAILYPEITKHIQGDFNAVMRLLYRIDISELKVKKQMDILPDDTPAALCTLIIKREIQKVILRKQYSKGQ